jgi:hypothetical protein
MIWDYSSDDRIPGQSHAPVKGRPAIRIAGLPIRHLGVMRAYKRVRLTQRPGEADALGRD